jgi:hypothetical protein
MAAAPFFHWRLYRHFGIAIDLDGANPPALENLIACIEATGGPIDTTRLLEFFGVKRPRQTRQKVKRESNRTLRHANIFPKLAFLLGRMARPARFERATLCLEGRCSIQLSYGRVPEMILEQMNRVG